MKRSLLSLLLFLACASGIFAQGLTLFSEQRPNGTAFFALDSKSGQLYYLLDYGNKAGSWSAYGTPIGYVGGGNFEFGTIKREAGSAFFAMEANTGQLYYMLDYGDAAGTWKNYGGTIGNGQFKLSTEEREAGTAFFAIEKSSGQLYFMLDYGDNPGVWKPYGTPVPR